MSNAAKPKAAKPDTNKRIRDLINKSTKTGQFVGVTFVKKNGEVRRMTIQNSAIKGHIVGSERGKKWANTMKEKHPNLLAVYSVDAHGVRTINLDTVMTVSHGNKTEVFRAPK